MKPALLVIDVQKAFFEHDPATTLSLERAVKTINKAIKCFRAKNLPVIAIQHMNEEDKLVPGEKGFDLSGNLNVLESDPHIHKTYGNAFCKTELEVKLHELGVDTVIVTGFLAEGCVLSTVRGAKDLDFTAIILRDAIASGSAENKRFVEEISEIISCQALWKVLQ